MKLRILAAVAALAFTLSCQAFGFGLGDSASLALGLRSIQPKYDPNDCSTAPLSIYESCISKKRESESAKAARDDAWYEKHSRYIRWTVIRSRLEGMPEECRYFYCDMHGGWVTKREANNEWVITLPRNKGAPEDCKFTYCQKVYTESDTSPAINSDYRGTGLDR